MDRRKSGEPLFCGVWMRLYKDEISSVERPDALRGVSASATGRAHKQLHTDVPSTCARKLRLTICCHGQLGDTRLRLQVPAQVVLL